VSFGLTFEKLLLIGLIAVILIGPDRLPGYAAQFGRFIRTLRDMANGAKTRMREEMGPDYDDVDWKKLDPRQYDPRRIIREALIDEPGAGAGAGAGPGAGARAAAGVSGASGAAGASGASGASGPGGAPARESAYAQRQRLIREGRPAPFDPEAT
jgi:sec-independent protein translocase protein TatB